MSAEDIQHVLGTKDYYMRLKVSRDATVEEIKKSYKRLAVRLHPDKNTLPRAEDAFKAVGQAHAVLADSQKRRVYDQVGEEGLNGESGARRAYHPQQPEDLFDLFDILRGFQPPQRRQHQQHNHQERRQREQANGLMQFMNSLPILILLLFYILSGMGLDQTDSVPYSLKQDYERGYTEQRITNDWAKVPYYVRPSFRRDYAGNRRAVREIETSVFRAHRGHLQKSCQKERAHKEMLLKRANQYENSEAMKEKASKVATPSCAELRRLNGGSDRKR